MKKIIVNGGTPLYGEVTVSGSKNASLPILFATLLTEGISVIDNLPDIGDVSSALAILESLGAKIMRRDTTCYIDTRTLEYREQDDGALSSLRASTYLIGSSLARFGRVRLGKFGGCNFSHRPIDLHIAAAQTLGAHLVGDHLYAEGLVGGEINLAKPSVGATVNALLLSATAKGESLIRGYAKEPHINSLIAFLRSAGASISVSGDGIRVTGAKLHGGKIRIIGDCIEAGTYLSLALATRGEITVSGIDHEPMRAFLEAVHRMGAEVNLADGRVSVKPSAVQRPVSVRAEPYPGFPTDLQPIIAVTSATVFGGVIKDFVWRERFGYLDTASAFGVVSIRMRDGCIVKPSVIHPANVTCPDLRAGAACLILALSARGESTLFSANLLLRGYSLLEEKLTSLGADVKIVN